MPLATWHERYATGIPMIDDQHKELFRAINELHDGFQEGRPIEAIRPLMNFLLTYTISHFRTEESFMEEQGYPDLQRHQDEHAHLIRKVQDLKRQIEGQAPPSHGEVAKFVGDWLKHHVSEVDMGYAAYIREKAKGSSLS